MFAAAALSLLVTTGGDVRGAGRRRAQASSRHIRRLQERQRRRPQRLHTANPPPKKKRKKKAANRRLENAGRRARLAWSAAIAGRPRGSIVGGQLAGGPPCGPPVHRSILLRLRLRRPCLPDSRGPLPRRRGEGRLCIRVRCPTFTRLAVPETAPVVVPGSVNFPCSVVSEYSHLCGTMRLVDDRPRKPHHPVGADLELVRVGPNAVGPPSPQPPGLFSNDVNIGLVDHGFVVHQRSGGLERSAGAEAQRPRRPRCPAATTAAPRLEHQLRRLRGGRRQAVTLRAAPGSSPSTILQSPHGRPPRLDSMGSKARQPLIGLLIAPSQHNLRGTRSVNARPPDAIHRESGGGVDPDSRGLCGDSTLVVRSPCQHDFGLHREGPSEANREGRFDPLIPKSGPPLYLTCEVTARVSESCEPEARPAARALRARRRAC